MTEETNIREKSRAVFLAALMVLSVFAMSASFAGAAAAQNADSQIDGTSTFTEIAFTGQDVNITVPSSFANNGDEIDVRRVDQRNDNGEPVSTSQTRVLQVNQGNITVDTDRLRGEGDYVFRNDNGQFLAGSGGASLGSSMSELEVLDQDLTATIDADRVNLGETTFAEFGSLRGDFDVYAYGTVDGEDLDGGELEAIFSDSQNSAAEFDTLGDTPGIDEDLADDRELIRVSAGDAATTELNFTDTATLDSGEYDFNFAVVDAAASDTDTLSVGDNVDVDAEFVGGPYTQERGDYVVITGQLTETDQATIDIGSAEAGYNATVEVTTDDVGDQFSIIWNSFSAGNTPLNDGAAPVDAQFTPVEDANVQSISGTIDLGTEVDGGINNELLVPGSYDLEITPAGADQSQDATTTILTERSTDEVVSWTTPASTLGAVGAADDPVAAIEASLGTTITQTDEIAEGDVLVSQIQATGLSGAIYEQQVLNQVGATQALKQLDNSGTIDLTFEQQNPTRNRAPIEIEFDSVANEQLTVVQDVETDTYYVAVEFDDFSDQSDLGITRDIPDETEFKAEFTVEAGVGLSEQQANNQLETFRYGLVAPNEDGVFEDETVTSQWEAVEPNIDVTTESDQITLEAAENQVINGTTNVAPGTELNFRVSSTNASETPFIAPGLTATVQPDGTYSVDSIDVAEATAGDDFEFVVRDSRFTDDSTFPGFEGQIADLEAAFFQVSDLSPEEATIEPGDSLTVSATVTNNGEQEGTQDVTLSAAGTTFGTEEVTLGAGESTTVSFDVGGDTTASIPAGEYTHTIASADSSASGTLTVASPASFQVSELDPAEATIEPGESLTVSATVTNDGGQEATQDVTLSVGDNTLATEEETLGGGESTTVSFDVAGETTEGLEPGEYTHAIASQDDTAEGQLTVEAPDPAFFEITEFSPQEATVSPGDSVEATVTVENTGEVEGTQTVTLSADNGLGELNSTEVTLGPGDSASESFSFTVPQVDSNLTVTHTLTTGDDEVSGTLNVVVEPDDTGSEDDGSADDGSADDGSADDGSADDGSADDGSGDDDGGDDGSSDDGGPGFGIAAALVAIIGAALLAYRRQQN